MSNPYPVLAELAVERRRQDEKWGEQNHPDGTGRPGDVAFAEAYKAICKANGPGEDTYRDILAEEVYEAFAETNPAGLRAELVQVAAVAVAWIEAIDRRAERGPMCRYCGADCSNGRSWDGGELYACTACSDLRADLAGARYRLLRVRGPVIEIENPDWPGGAS